MFGKRTDHGNAWWWCDLFYSFSLARLSESVLLSTVEMTQNVQNFAVKPRAAGEWFHLCFEHFDVISMVDKSTDHGEMLSNRFVTLNWTFTVIKFSEQSVPGCSNVADSAIQRINDYPAVKYNVNQLWYLLDWDLPTRVQRKSVLQLAIRASCS